MYPLHTHQLATGTLTVYCTPAFSDNYQWMIEHQGKTLLVDPGDAASMLQAIETYKLHPAAILITHKHWDHVDGADAIAEKFDLPIYAPKGVTRCNPTNWVSDHQQLQLCGLPWQIMATPGHTLEHISWIITDTTPALAFVGDTLFAGGCGKLFEGTPQQMYHSIQKLLYLPEDTLIYCGHEYTRANLAFAKHIEPENTAIQRRIDEIREHTNPTIPTNLQLEKATNPFCRISILKERNPQWQNASNAEVFALIRQQKDTFSPTM